MAAFWNFMFLCLISAHYSQGFSSQKYTQQRGRTQIRNDILKDEAATTTASDVGEPLILTSYIKQNKLIEAREAARVDEKHMPPGIDSYAGYFTVNEKYNGNLFFWYFPVSGKSIEDTPWLIWLQGGPGGSSLFGLFTEVGPLQVVNGTLEEMKHSWGKTHSIVFIDNPVGTGYSFSDIDGYATNQTTIGENLYCGLQQFLTVFPELRKAPLTIAGESYAGKHIPSLGIQIHWYKDQQQPINFHGVAIGNGFIDPETIKQQTDLLELIGLHGVDTPNPYNFLSNDDPSAPAEYVSYIKRDEVRLALHVGNVTYDYFNQIVLGKLTYDIYRSAKHWLEELINNYNVLSYVGQLDTVCPYSGLINTYAALSFSGDKEYRKAPRQNWNVGQTLAGFYKRGGNFTDVLVRGAGHMVPIDKPREALALISDFVRGHGIFA